MADPTAPAGGFLQGGWYGGRQMWNGVLGAPGVINNPEQQGYQQPVSSEVNRQSDVAQGLPVGTIDKYIAEQSQSYYADTGNAPPTDASQVTPDLNNYQAGLFGEGGDIATRMADMKNLLTGGKTAPEPINRVEEFGALRTQYGVADLEKQLTDVNKQIADVQSLAEQRQYKAETGQVSLGVIGGRQTEIQRQTNIQLDTLNRSKSVMVDELNTRYNIIKTMIDYMGLDYNDAVAAYDREYSQNLQIYQQIVTEDNEAKASARANLTTMANLITSGNMNFNQLDSSQRLMINKLEVQAGLPIGFTSSLQMSPKDKILFTSTNGGITQVGMVNQQGGVTVQSYGTATGGGGTGGGTVKTTAEETAQNKANLIIDVKEKARLQDLVNYYSQVLSVDAIYSLYNQYSPWGPATETLQQVKQGLY